ncbi:PAS domain S-box protein [Methanoregula sp.]|uniref:hybrid sensor histidine kinase/response regulator n=1 Tax=Methanoregula sp. TaxID=2052170 RepID=UPI00237236D6|nr:PAS domain S-box protein [Methanoregula sp.]MDD1687457.1 PAS domain S-box protein [Methanoregula sp.]
MLHVLYIDDESDLLEICKLYLEVSGEYTIDTVTSATAGLELLKKTSYDVVVCDYQMPGMDGITLLKTLRAQGNDLPFILFTGRGREEVVIQALNNGADFYIQKGGDPEALFIELAHIIQQLVGRRKADEQLRKTNIYLTNLITHAPNPIVTWDVNSKITRFNQAFEKLTGFSETNVLGHDFDVLFPEDSRASSLDLVVRALFGEKWEAVEIPIRTIHGEVRTVIWNSANIYDTDGITPVATIAMGSDITERKKAEARLNVAYEELAATEEELRQQYEQLGEQEKVLRKNKERLNSIVRTAPTGIAVLRDRIMTELNDRFCTMTGYSRQELEGKDLRIIWPEAGGYLPEGEMDPGAAGERQNGGAEARWQKKDGTVITVILSSTPLNPQDPSLGATLTALDITSRVMADEALRTANRKLGLLTSITRHDILNKISIIDSNLALIRRKGISLDISGYIEKIGTASREIQSQIEFGRIYQNLGNTASRWQDIASILPVTMVPDSVRFHADIDDFEVYADPMLEKVFFNLFDNSLRHGGGVHEIRVTHRESGTGLIILWEDDGVGIGADEKERIFERGYGKNTGLGLFLVREILAITGIGIRETGIPGAGARFELVVPKGGYRIRRHTPADDRKPRVS